MGQRILGIVAGSHRTMQEARSCGDWADDVPELDRLLAEVRMERLQG